MSRRLRTKEAAELLDLSPRQLRNLAALGRIPGAKRNETERGPVTPPLPAP